MSITEISFREMNDKELQYRSHIQCFQPFHTSSCSEILWLKSCVWTNMSFLARLLVSMLGIYFLCSFIFWMQIQVSNLKIPETNSLPLWVELKIRLFFIVSCLLHVCWTEFSSSLNLFTGLLNEQVWPTMNKKLFAQHFLSGLSRMVSRKFNLQTRFSVHLCSALN